jgi:NAD+ kinase
MTNRPLVLQDDAVIEIRLIVTREQGYLTIDGQQGEPLEEHDVVICKRSLMQVKLFKLPDRTFFQVLRAKLKWGER